MCFGKRDTKNSEPSEVKTGGRMGIRIVQTASYKASRTVDNNYFETILDTSDEWITSRTGIAKRNFVTDENTASMSIAVARTLHADAGDEIGKRLKLILNASFSPDLIVPSIAAKVQKELSLHDDIYCADLNMGCTGFVGALILAERYLADGEYGMIIASETISDYLDFSDRTTAVLFGDGAAGVIVQKTSEGLYEAKMNTYGNDTDLFMMKEGKVSMQGNNVYRFTIDKVPKSMLSVIECAGLTLSDIDHVVCHQANIRIIEQIMKHTGIAGEKFYANLDRYGNTSAASVPIVLNEMNEKGLFKRGDRILIVAFGAGLTVGTVLTEW